jgi:hypothetical protein
MDKNQIILILAKKKDKLNNAIRKSLIFGKKKIK